MKKLGLTLLTTLVIGMGSVQALNDTKVAATAPVPASSAAVADASAPASSAAASTSAVADASAPASSAAASTSAVADASVPASSAAAATADAKQASKLERIKAYCTTLYGKLPSRQTVKEYCGAPYKMTTKAAEYVFSKMPFVKKLFGENAAKVAAALGLVALAAAVPSTVPFYVPQLVSAITVLSTVYLTTETVEAVCTWYSALKKTHPWLAIAIAPMTIALVVVAYKTGVISKAFNLLPAWIVNAGRNAASKLNLVLDLVPGHLLHINSAAEAAIAAPWWKFWVR